jgi:hypothetical protein
VVAVGGWVGRRLFVNVRVGSFVIRMLSHLHAISREADPR